MPRGTAYKAKTEAANEAAEALGYEQTQMKVKKPSKKKPKAAPVAKTMPKKTKPAKAAPGKRPKPSDPGYKKWMEANNPSAFKKSKEGKSTKVGREAYNKASEAGKSGSEALEAHDKAKKAERTKLDGNTAAYGAAMNKAGSKMLKKMRTE